MTSKPAILYIEDNADNRRLVRRVLEARDFNVLTADDGPAGLSLAREARPALILVDIDIPQLDGHETTTRLRSLEHLKGVPIIALSADGRTITRERALAAGCDGYITKPIDVRRFPEQVQEFIGGRRESLPASTETAALREYASTLVERLERQVAEVSAKNAELQELDRLKSQFLAMLSHELRTPLTSILGYLELFEHGTLGQLDGSQGEALGVIARNAQILSRRLNSLLYLQEVRSSQLKRSPFDIYDLVRRAANEYQVRASAAGLTLQVQLQPSEPFSGDALAIDQAIRHLIDNAIKFTPARGQVVVALGGDAARLVLRVQDTGIGITPELHERIFQPFFRVDSSLSQADGVGIGLAIVKHAVEAHGGQVLVRSVPGKGSAFTVLLPRA